MGFGLEQYVNLVFLVADRDHVTHLRIVPAGTSAVIDFWRDDAWHEMDLTDRSAPLHMPVMRHLATMLLGDIPTQGSTLAGNFALARDGKPDICVLGVLVNDFDIAAYFELVDLATYETGREPTPPGGRASFRAP